MRGEGNGELLIKGHTVPAKQDEWALEICCIILYPESAVVWS